MYIEIIFLEKPIHTTNIKYFFFPVDSVAHDFMFNLTPCSIVNKPIWSLALTWIPSESLL